MKRNGFLYGCSVAAVLSAALGAGTAAFAANTASCTFGTCSAQLTTTTLTVSCDGKQVYNGAFSLTSDFQTTEIAADPAGDPKIAAQGMPGVGTVQASLSVAGKTTAGSCGVGN